MDIKSMMVKAAESQADEIRNSILETIQSEETEKYIAEKMDKAINIPFVKDEKEAKIFRDVADLITDVIYYVSGGK
tara:strand:- start:16667 stop:16894 length:228 start_codon:yes stop_codon:yes gene_type:complete